MCINHQYLGGAVNTAARARLLDRARLNRERDIRQARRNKVAWFSDTVQSVENAPGSFQPAVTTPTKYEAYDGRIYVLNVEKCDFLARRARWIQETPNRSRPIFDYHVTRDYERRPNGR